MPIQSSFLNRKRTALMLTLVIFSASVFMLTYSGRIESSDTRSLFDAVSSLVQYGDNYLDISAWYTYPPPTAQGLYPLAPIETEPLQPILAAPLFWIAEHLPGIGLTHTVWLFNIVISALACGVLFLYALALGYRETTAIVAALLLGLGTIVWPYSKTFFREPLALLLILLASLLIERWRVSHYRSLPLLVAVILSLVGAWLSKEAVILAMPALVIIVAPVLPIQNIHRRLMIIFLSLVMIGFVVLLLVSILPDLDSLTGIYTQVGSLIRKNPSQVGFIHTALHSYLLSIGGSFWATSPVVLLAVPGLTLLYRRGYYRYVLALIVLVFTFAFGYAMLRGVYWFGGLSWPPRFLIPIIPLLMIGTLPALDMLITRLAPRWLVALTVIVVIYSLWIQINGVLLPWEAYAKVLPPESSGLGEWGGGLNSIQYLRWVVLPSLWGQEPFDLAWVRVNISWWPLAFAGLCAFCIFLMRTLLIEKTDQKTFFAKTKVRVCSLPLAFILVVGLSLSAIYRDPFYLGDHDSLHAFLPTIESVGKPGDVLLLDSTAYSTFFMNYGKFKYPRVITLSDQPGEQPSPEQPAKITSDNPDALLLKITAPLIQNVASVRNHLWLMEDAGPWLPWRIRPIERYMVSHYYPAQELSTTPPDPIVRLIEFSTIDAPDNYGFRGGEHPTDLKFGQQIQLLSFTLPEGITYHPGDIFPLSLYWQVAEKIETNYTVAWFLANEDGSRIIQGVDYQPGWGFAPISQWQAGVPVWDNRALRIPDDLPPGQYQVWVRLYQSDAPDTLLSVSGAETNGDTIGILPVRIDISQ
jgi:hypothetical protein